MKANYANALCHCNATPLSVAVLAPCAWSENLACGVAWQGVLLGRSGVWQGTLNSAKRNTAWRGEFGNEMAQQSKRSKFSVASVCGQNSTRQIRLGKRGEMAVFADKADKAKMEQCLGGGPLSR